MKKRILIGFGLVLFVFLIGSIVAMLFLTKTMDRMDNLFALHQAEIMHDKPYNPCRAGSVLY